jgi:hypothetical protein
VVIIVLVLIGLNVFFWYENAQCGGLVGCGPVDEPAILNANVVQPSGTTVCAITQGFPLAATCDVLLYGGISGAVVMNLTSRGGNSTVAFGTYSSESQNIRFTSTYPCLYSRSSPDYNTARCLVSETGSTYRFNFTVAQSLPPGTEAILTIVVTKTCCWP